MGDAFTHLFGRDFVVAHCLPAAVLLILFGAIFALVGLQAPWAEPFVELLAAFKNADLKAVVTDASFVWTFGALLFFIWLLGLVLHSVNTFIVRFFEGYGTLNPLQCFRWLERGRLRRTNAYVEKYKASARANETREFTLEQKKSYYRRRLEQATRFPEEPYLMPTRFGNTVRAFEDYPRLMYGLEGTTGWYRLLAVVPKDYLMFISTARAQVDLCLNMALVLWICIVEYFVLCGMAFSDTFRLYPSPWLIVGLILWAWVAIKSASAAAAVWGEWVKGAFDVYLQDLRTKLAFDRFESADVERTLWVGFSQAITYRSPKKLPHRSQAAERAEENVQQAGKSGFLTALVRRVFGEKT